MAILKPLSFIDKTGRTFTLRNFVSSEAEILNQFMEQIGRESQNTLQYPGYKRFTIEEQEKRIQKSQESLADLLLGVFSEEKIVGALMFSKGYGAHPWYQHHASFGMMILQECWGMGLGKEMLRVMENHARVHGVTRIAAEVRTFNERGIKLYTHNGFKIEGTRKNSAFIDGKMTDEYYIAKLLDEKFPRWTPPTLTTDRLILRAIRLEDAPSMFAYTSIENVTRYVLFDVKKSVEEVLDGIKNYFFAKYDQQEPEGFAITLKSDPKTVIGTVGTWWSSQTSQCMEMGYILSEKHWNQGILTEAAKEVIRYCFEEYSREISPVNRIQAHCKLENAASAKVMEKISMQYEATHRQRVFNKGRFWDMKVYAILKEDWLKK